MIIAFNGTHFSVMMPTYGNMLFRQLFVTCYQKIYNKEVTESLEFLYRGGKGEGGCVVVCRKLYGNWAIQYTVPEEEKSGRWNHLAMWQRVRHRMICSYKDLTVFTYIEPDKEFFTCPIVTVVMVVYTVHFRS